MTAFQNEPTRRKQKKRVSAEFYERGVTLHKRMLQDAACPPRDLEAIGLWLEEFARPNRREEISANAYIWYIYGWICLAPLSLLALPFIEKHIHACAMVPVLNLVLLETWQRLTQRSYLSRYDERVRFLATDFASAIFANASPRTVGPMISLRCLYYGYQFSNRTRLQDILPANAEKQLEGALLDANLTPDLNISPNVLARCNAVLHGKRGFGAQSMSKRVRSLIQQLQTTHGWSNR